MKRIIFLVFLFMIISCSSDDKQPSVEQNSLSATVNYEIPFEATTFHIYEEGEMIFVGGANDQGESITIAFLKNLEEGTYHFNFNGYEAIHVYEGVELHANAGSLFLLENSEDKIHIAFEFSTINPDVEHEPEYDYETIVSVGSLKYYR